MVAVLKRLGVPAMRGRETAMLDAYFADLMRQAKRACAERWPNVIAATGLERLMEYPPDGAGRSAPVAAVSRMTDAIEAIYGAEAPEVLRQWGKLAMESWVGRTWQKPRRLWSSPERRIEDVVTLFTRDLDRVRGERLTAWKKVDGRDFWVVCYDNLGAVGRRRPGRSCHLWTAALEQALRWAGAANRCVVDEAECGCVTGTYDCVFTIQYVDL
jgi:hypothetical protein